MIAAALGSAAAFAPFTLAMAPVALRYVSRDPGNTKRNTPFLASRGGMPSVSLVVGAHRGSFRDPRLSASSPVVFHSGTRWAHWSSDLSVS